MVVGVVVLATAFPFLTSCGGGTDIAPSQPVIEGRGFASAMIGSRDFGESSQIDAGVSDVQTASGTVVDELVTIRPDGFGIFQHGLLSSPIVGLTAPAGTPTYCQGLTAACVGVPTCPIPPSPTLVTPCDFWLADSQAGLIQISPTGALAGGSTVLADYTYNRRLLQLNIGLTFASGQFMTIVAFHVPSDSAAPLDITDAVSSAPIDPFPMGFNVLIQTNLTTSGDRELFTSIDGSGYLLHFSRLDLTNEANPCIEGTLSVTVRSDADPTPIPVTASFRTPGC